MNVHSEVITPHGDGIVTMLFSDSVLVRLFNGDEFDFPLSDITEKFIVNKPQRQRDSRIRLSDSLTNEDRVYHYVKESALFGLTADDGVQKMEQEDADEKPKVNQVAPVLSTFKKMGIVVWRGTRFTRSGGTAHINILSDNAETLFYEMYGRAPLER